MSEPEISTAAVDRIGSLPDDTLIHILSFVSTKQAVATSILSKRWIHLWRSVPVLDFTETKLEDRDSVIRFEEFVFSVLRLREAAGNHSINTFILDIERHSSRLRDLVFGNWDETITPELPQLPPSILSYTTLVVLKLASFDMCAGFFLDVMRLPSLKTLHLKNINFEIDEDLMLILEKFPILEDLQLSNIYGNDVPYDWISNDDTLRQLKRADITICYCLFPMKALSNVEFLCIQLSKDNHPYDFPTFNNLTHLVLNYDWDIVVQVLQHCPQLQNLDLYQKLQGDHWNDEYIAEDDQENWAYPNFVPSCLSLNLTTCTIRDFAFAGLERNHIMLARFILKNARVLKTMSVWCCRKRSKIKRQLSRFPRASPTCQLSIY